MKVGRKGTSHVKPPTYKRATWFVNVLLALCYYISCRGVCYEIATCEMPNNQKTLFAWSL